MRFNEFHRRAVAMLVLLLLTPGAASGQMISAATKVDWTASVQPSSVAPGDTATVRLTASIADGWKVYAVDSPPPSRGVRVAFDSVAAGLSAAGAVQQSAPKRGFDPYFEKTVTYFETDATLHAPFTVAPTAGPGPHRVRGTVTFMVCNDRLCLPPTRTAFEAAVTVGHGDGYNSGGNP
jgi:thiol:disulfide interchange protein DsbD